MEKYLAIIETLAQGVDPSTGEELPSHSPYNNPDVIRALFFAISTMKIKAPNSTIKKKSSNQNLKQTIEEKQAENIAKGKPKNAGLPWTDEQRLLLTQHFSAEKPIEQIAEIHERTNTAIVSELKKLNLVV